MRLFASLLALSILIGCAPPPAVKPAAPKTSSGVTSASATPKLETPAPSHPGAKLVAFSVPHMTCQHNCWPEVKKTLEGQEGVEIVTLAKQPNEDEVVDKRVFVEVGDKFNSQAALDALSKIGFDESKVIDN